MLEGKLGEVPFPESYLGTGADTQFFSPNMSQVITTLAVPLHRSILYAKRLLMSKIWRVYSTVPLSMKARCLIYT
jgi:hypothetical protein